MTPCDDFISSSEVSRICGASLRELQFWRERNIVRPYQYERGKHHSYTVRQAIEIFLVVRLRSKGLTLKRAKQVLAFYRKHPELKVILILRRQIMGCQDWEEAIKRSAEAPCGVVAVQVPREARVRAAARNCRKNACTSAA
jgi:DNA-binding transcriptional MerR regulator